MRLEKLKSNNNELVRRTASILSLDISDSIVYELRSDTRRYDIQVSDKRKETEENGKNKRTENIYNLLID
jgi:hypothetical protein